MASLRKKGRVWYFRFTDAGGQKHEWKGCTDKRATQEMAAAVEVEMGRVRSGLSDPRDEARRRHEARPLAEHLRDWHATLTAKGNTPKHAALYLDRARRIGDLTGAKKLSDLTPARVQSALAALRSEGRSLATLNHHRGAIRSFSRWAWKDGRLRDDPLAGVSGFNAKEDRRHDRRTLPLEDVRRLIDAAYKGAAFRKMTGPARALCYRLAIGTGLRYSELASLTVASFDLGPTPSVTVLASYAKNGRAATLPVPIDLAADLAPHIATLALDAPVFPLPTDLGAAMLRVDLDAAGIPYRDEAGLVFDFHALRCQCATLLDGAGVSPRVVQRIMRHSTLELSGRYTRPTLHDIEGAAAALPSLAPTKEDPETLAATGTEGTIKTSPLILSHYFPTGGPGNSRDMSRADVSMKGDDLSLMGRNSQDSSGVSGNGRAVSGVVASSGVRDRTGDLRVMNPPL